VLVVGFKMPQTDFTPWKTSLSSNSFFCYFKLSKWSFSLEVLRNFIAKELYKVRFRKFII
jgi:hypothetical protein